jgi:hypothetical protein
MLWIVFAAGLLVGGIGGALAIALCVASKTREQTEENSRFKSQSGSLKPRIPAQHGD